MGTGTPPACWNRLIAEFMVSDCECTLAFWTGVGGFSVAFARPAQRLACLRHPDGAQIMFYERDGDWETGPLDLPFGRGTITQIFVRDVGALADRVRTAGLPFFVAPPARNGATGAIGSAVSANSLCKIPMAI